MASSLQTPDLIINLTAEPDALLYTYSYAETVVITALYPIILALGLFGNFAFLFTIARVRRMRTEINVYLGSLAFTAVVLLVVGISSTLARYRASPVPIDSTSFGPVGCAAVSFLQDVSTWAAHAFGVAVPIVLYHATCRPHLFRRLRGMKRAIVTSAWLWVVVTCIGLCFLPTWWNFVWYGLVWANLEQYQDYPEVIGVCSAAAEWLVITHDLLQSTTFFLCALNGNIIFAIIIRSLRKRFRSIGLPSGTDGNRKSAGAQAVKRNKSRRQVFRMVVLSSVAFFAFPMPYDCILFAQSVARLTGKRVLADEQFKALLFASTTLLYVTPAICPYIYVLSNPGYRIAVVQAFTKKPGGRSNRSVGGGAEMSTLAG
ncbi:delta-type opioid receptor-like [Acanthaster planci]|uniref:Delta-type opioid receptor-like n=1 Tax=Acanthaster planci TaxID=133434 RepID=A0A8B7XU88_ACAPL|nr:delta-type opioid receptor-like [Acanthaster planci]